MRLLNYFSSHNYYGIGSTAGETAGRSQEYIIIISNNSIIPSTNSTNPLTGGGDILGLSSPVLGGVLHAHPALRGVKPAAVHALATQGWYVSLLTLRNFRSFIEFSGILESSIFVLETQRSFNFQLAVNSNKT